MWKKEKFLSKPITQRPGYAEAGDSSYSIIITNHAM